MNYLSLNNHSRCFPRKSLPTYFVAGLNQENRWDPLLSPPRLLQRVKGFRVLRYTVHSSWWRDERIKARIEAAIYRLEEYPLSLKEMDVEKIMGLERTFKIRVGRDRIVFCG